MKIGVWGAGAIGSGLAYRLATTPFTSQLYWINRSFEKIRYRAIDIEQGLALAPSCWQVRASPQERVAEILPQLEILILTLGIPVPAGKKREDVYAVNRDLFRETVVPALSRSFGGIVIVVTNPVDLMARFVQREARLEPERVLGLGTVVETARLRASLGSYLSPQRPAREVWAYAVGSHDENFVPVAMAGFGMGITIDPAELTGILELARREVVQAAARVKRDTKSTLHPIVEGVLEVVEAIALDRRSVLTVSVLDPESEDRLYYSMPCSLGYGGVVARHEDLLKANAVQAGLEASRDGLRHTLRQAGDP